MIYYFKKIDLKQKSINTIIYLTIFLIFNLSVYSKSHNSSIPEKKEITSKEKFVDFNGEKYFQYENNLWRINNVTELDEENKSIVLSLGYKLYDFEIDTVFNNDNKMLLNASNFTKISNTIVSIKYKDIIGIYLYDANESNTANTIFGLILLAGLAYLITILDLWDEVLEATTSSDEY